ncbi:MAG: hypothetical protein PVJ53_03980 [Desulfobacterales bacterium]
MYALFLVYTVGLKDDISRLPWLCLIPLASLFISGRKAGWIGFFLVYLGVILCDFLSPATDGVDIPALKLRIYLSVLMLTYIAFSLERVHRNLYLKVQKKNTRLQESEASLRWA